MNTTRLLKEELEDLYSSGKSMTEISTLLKCSTHKIVYWMTKYGIKRRTMSQAIYVKSNPNGDPFKIKDNMNYQEKFLYGLGLGIYWGEGEKTSKGHVRVANTNPSLLRTFRDFLTINCQVLPSRLHYYLICFNDSNPEEAKEFWAKELNIAEEKFGKIVQIPPQGKGSYRRKSNYGVCTVEVSNTKLKYWIMQELDKLNVMPR